MGEIALQPYLLWFNEVGMNDVDQVGGKNASLGEMLSNLTEVGIRVPNGFATTAAAYRDFIHQEGLYGRILETLKGLNIDDVSALSAAGKTIRDWILEAPLPQALDTQVREAYATLAGTDSEYAVAVRSSATAEDLPSASAAMT